MEHQMSEIGKTIFDGMNAANRDYVESMTSTRTYGEIFNCFECGGCIVLNTKTKRDRYNSSGMCATCEQKALGESDPVSAMFEMIIERLEGIEKEIFRQGGRS